MCILSLTDNDMMKVDNGLDVSKHALEKHGLSGESF
jgi:hypothetical protein